MISGLGHTAAMVAAGAALLGLVAGVLGSFALLRRQSLLGDVLSHAALPGVCAGFLIAGVRAPAPLMAGAFVSGALAALAVLLISRQARLKPDVAMAIVLSVFFGVGVVLLSVVQGQAGGAQAGLSVFLFGQAAAMLRADVQALAVVAVICLTLVAVLWKEFALITFDRDMARAQGLPVALLEGVLTLMVALAIVAGLQIVGVVLMVAMLIAPAVAARLWAGRLSGMVWLAAAFGVVAGVAGALISASARGLATGPVVVLAACAIVAVSALLAPRRGLMARLGLRLGGATPEAVLHSLGRLAAMHAMPDYPAEHGMIAALHGRGTDRALRHLGARGLIAPVLHPPERTRHWCLTASGHAELRARAGEGAGEKAGEEAEVEAGGSKA
jgi:manganese/zinc/iron transport system permease protein